jgi:hypothetical protein
MTRAVRAAPFEPIEPIEPIEPRRACRSRRAARAVPPLDGSGGPVVAPCSGAARRRAEYSVTAHHHGPPDGG